MNKVRWGLAAGGFLAAEALLIAISFAWVAFYSYVVNPGHPADYYEQYAESHIPYVGLLLGAVVFFLVCRWIAARDPWSARATALAIFALVCVTEIATMFAAPNPVVTPLFEAVNLPLKLLSCWGGATILRRPA